MIMTSGLLTGYPLGVTGRTGKGVGRVRVKPVTGRRVIFPKPLSGPFITRTRCGLTGTGPVRTVFFFCFFQKIQIFLK